MNNTVLSHADQSAAYQAGILDGSILACKHVINACRRNQNDLKRQTDESYPYKFDPALGERVCNFIELLPHVKGEWARIDPNNPNSNRIRLEPWQSFFVHTLFSWVKKTTGKRRFRKASLYVPRKNAKSTLAAAIGWWMFAKDGEPGAEVYSGATTEKQAWEVFGPARQMGLINKALPKGLGSIVNASNIIRPHHNAKFEPIIGKPGDGASPHCAIVDEYHEHATSVLYDTMMTGMGARRQPLLLIISTAGDNIAGPCRDDWRDLEKILGGTIEDEQAFGMIYTVDDHEKEWMTIEGLKKANPNYNISVSEDFLLDQQKKALRDARSQGVFKIKHANLWVTARNAFYNMESWRLLADPTLKIEDFKGKDCILAVDLAAKIDLAVVMIIFPISTERIVVFCKAYLPDKTAELPENQHYQKWKDEGRLIVSPGNMTDLTLIRQDVIEFAKDHHVLECCYDPDGATLLVQDLTAEGITCVEIPQTMAMLSDPMKHLDAMIKEGWIKHDGDPVLEWSLSNVIPLRDRNDRVKPGKERPELKIDPAVALIMGLQRFLKAEPISTGPGIMFS